MHGGDVYTPHSKHISPCTATAWRVGEWTKRWIESSPKEYLITMTDTHSPAVDTVTTAYGVLAAHSVNVHHVGFGTYHRDVRYTISLITAKIIPAISTSLNSYC